MNYSAVREELRSFYLTGDIERSKSFADKCFKILDEKVTLDMSVPAQKLLQYDVICEHFEPVIFKTVPFYYETGVLTSLSDGARRAKNGQHIQAAGWVFMRNCHNFRDQDEALYEKRNIQGWEEILYLICGDYNDISQHINFNYRPLFKSGLRGIYERAQELKDFASTDEQKTFLNSVCHAMLTLKAASEKFAQKALKLSETEENAEYKANLLLIADTAKRVPWERPQSFYEALNTLAFMRTAIGTFEGVGPNTFGRVDVDLYPFYKSDIDSGVLTQEKAYELICKFLLLWDMHYEHDMKMEGYADHELENTYTLGGCDGDGKPVYNELTKMFLKAAREESIIIPKIKCRFSANSPKEYFDEINTAVIRGTSTILYQNDDATIPALTRAGRPLEEARDYRVSGCWAVVTNQEKYDHGGYVNLLKPFEIAVHRLYDKMKRVGIDFEVFDDCNTFEDLYRVTVENCKRLLRERMEITRRGAHVFHKVDSFPMFSSTLENCLEKMAEYTRGGAKYRDDYLLFVGFPNIIDSLLAIKSLVFDKNKYTLSQMLDAVRNNWEGHEDMRTEAVKCHGWGDGSEESCTLGARFQNDLYAIASKLPGTYGGKVHIGHLCYTEIRWWGEKTLATPDGRRSGEYFAHGLTPSRLKKIPNVTDVIYSMSQLDASTMAANSVVNIILPGGKVTLDVCEAFLRAVAGSAVQTLQLNCVKREDLLDAQIHPENYPDLVVRVTGFSAKFTCLSPEWQAEVLSRNFYE